MKKLLLLIVSVGLLASCAPKKYAYNFDYHDYQAGKKTRAVEREVMADPGPATVQPELLTASAPVVETQETAVAPQRQSYVQMSKAEKKEFRKEFKTALKQAVKMKKESPTKAAATNRIDNDLKLAAIFGAVGLVALIISGQLFYIIGGIALIIGVVFFVKWLIRQ